MLQYVNAVTIHCHPKLMARNYLKEIMFIEDYHLKPIESSLLLLLIGIKRDVFWNCYQAEPQIIETGKAFKSEWIIDEWNSRNVKALLREEHLGYNNKFI